jgi:hypothetical protein
LTIFFIKSPKIQKEAQMKLHVVGTDGAEKDQPDDPFNIGAGIPEQKGEGIQPASAATASEASSESPQRTHASTPHGETTARGSETQKEMQAPSAFDRPQPSEPLPSASGGTTREDYWMSIIEANPDLSYHQAEAIRLICGSDPRQLPENIDRAVYVLHRMRALV